MKYNSMINIMNIHRNIVINSSQEKKLSLKYEKMLDLAHNMGKMYIKKCRDQKPKVSVMTALALFTM